MAGSYHRGRAPVSRPGRPGYRAAPGPASARAFPGARPARQEAGVSPESLLAELAGSGGGLTVSVPRAGPCCIPVGDQPAVPDGLVPAGYGLRPDECHPALAAPRSQRRLPLVSDGRLSGRCLSPRRSARSAAGAATPFGLRDDEEPSFQVTVGEDCFAFTLSEESERREAPDPGCQSEL